MIIRTPKEEIKEYEESRANGLSITQSKLKLLPLGMREFNRAETEAAAALYFAEKGYELVGSAIDCRLTEGLQEFNDRYYLSDSAKPGEKVLAIVQHIFDIECRVNDNKPTPTLDELLIKYPTQGDENPFWIAMEFANYYPKWSYDAKAKAIMKDGAAYYKSLTLSVGKTVLSLEQHSVVMAIYNSIISDERFRIYFAEHYCPPHIDIYHQKIITVTYRGVEIGMLLDIMEVNHQTKTIRVIDFKTMFDHTMNFPNSMRQRRYDFQVVLYTIGVTLWKKTHPDLIGYSVLLPAFIVETTTVGQQGKPLMFKLTNQAFKVAQKGISKLEVFDLSDDSSITMRTKKIWGIDETIDLYKWHLDKDDFSADKVVLENNGMLNLNWEGIADDNTA